MASPAADGRERPSGAPLAAWRGGAVWRRQLRHEGTHTAREARKRGGGGGC
uniref:Uncharacterized protein n=1 Tax=Arundo donax TaxID=35708 RepID=A0A0A9E7P5_ARUDO